MIILHALRNQADRLQGTSPDKGRHAVQQSLVTFHLNLLILQNYVALNFTAISKILKKFDKRCKLQLRSEYISAIVELPFYRVSPPPHSHTYTYTHTSSVPPILLTPHSFPRHSFHIRA